MGEVAGGFLLDVVVDVPGLVVLLSGEFLVPGWVFKEVVCGRGEDDEIPVVQEAVNVAVRIE